MNENFVIICTIGDKKKCIGVFRLYTIAEDYICDHIDTDIETEILLVEAP